MSLGSGCGTGGLLPKHFGESYDRSCFGGRRLHARLEKFDQLDMFTSRRADWSPNPCHYGVYDSIRYWNGAHDDSSILLKENLAE